MKKVWKVVLTFIGTFFFIHAFNTLIQAWIAGAVDEWPLAHGLTAVSLISIVITIALYPFIVREPGETYWGILRKYFF